jgi:hypothetical protein
MHEAHNKLGPSYQLHKVMSFAQLMEIYVLESMLETHNNSRPSYQVQKVMSFERLMEMYDILIVISKWKLLDRDT